MSEIRKALVAAERAAQESDQLIAEALDALRDMKVASAELETLSRLASVQRQAAASFVVEAAAIVMERETGMPIGEAMARYFKAPPRLAGGRPQ